MEDKTIYRIKKWCFLTSIILLNAICCYITYIYQDLLIITMIYIILKSKDIISVIGIVLHNLFKRLFSKKEITNPDKCKIIM